MSNVPPPPYPAHGKGYTSVTIGGREIYVFGPDGYSQPFKLSDWPTSGLTKMAKWEITAKAGDPDKYSDFATTQCKAWLAGQHTSDNGQAIAQPYAIIVGNTPTASPLPGSGAAGKALSGVLSVGEFLGKLVEWITDPHFWLRVLEVGLGAVLVGVGLSHLSAGADSAIKSIPVYGHAVNRAMHPAPRRAYQGRHSA